MAVIVDYSPQSVIARAMFNFDAFGDQDFTLGGTVRVSVSDSFSSSDFQSTNYSDFYSDLWTRASSEVAWTATQLNNIQEMLAIYARYANIDFQWAGDFDVVGSDTTVNPEDVGRSGLSDINLSLISRRDAGIAGISGASSDDFLGYTGSTGDLFINSAAAKFSVDVSFAEGTRARQTLMHELGHSLGMSHPHTAFRGGVATISADFAATQFLGFAKLGFRTDSPADMNKEYFTVMSYDDQASLDSTILGNAFTPMILDVIALQEAYGEGAGTSGSANDTIEAGNIGYRTYFDTGGTDTIDLAFYFDGAYLDMGEDIAGAPHKVGVAMSFDDGQNTILHAEDPRHLRWFYGEYENAIGSDAADLILDSSLDNSINAGAGDDTIVVRGGSDSVDGGAGYDIVQYLNDYDDYAIRYSFADLSFNVADLTAGRDGTDVLRAVEELQFAGSSKTAASLIASITADAAPVAAILVGGASDDILTGGEGNDAIAGGTGIDTALYSGNRAAYSLSGTSTGFTLGGGNDGVDTLNGIERLQFADTRVALDLDGAAGNSARIIGAAFGAQYLADKSLVGVGLSLFDSGMTPEQVADIALGSALFGQLAGSRSNDAVVTQLYTSVVGVAPTAADRDEFVGLLDQGMRQADLLVLAANSDLNGTRIDITGLVQTGIEYS